MTIKYDEIFILSGGKTGSKTLFISFMRLVEALSSPAEVIHMHRMRHNPRLLQAIQGRKKRILIVNSYRLPFSRHVSSLFQNLRLHIPELGDKNNLENTPRNLELLTHYMDKCMNDGNFFADNHSFLDDLPFPLPPFDTKAGFTFHQQVEEYPAIDLLMLRFDQMDQWEEQIQSVFPSFVLIPHNVTSTKPFAALYETFSKTYQFPTGAHKILLEREQSRIQYYYGKEAMDK